MFPLDIEDGNDKSIIDWMHGSSSTSFAFWGCSGDRDSSIISITEFDELAVSIDLPGVVTVADDVVAESTSVAVFFLSKSTLLFENDFFKWFVSREMVDVRPLGRMIPFVIKSIPAVTTLCAIPGCSGRIRCTITCFDGRLLRDLSQRDCLFRDCEQVKTSKSNDWFGDNSVHTYV